MIKFSLCNTYDRNLSRGDIHDTYDTRCRKYLIMASSLSFLLSFSFSSHIRLPPLHPTSSSSIIGADRRGQLGEGRIGYRIGSMDDESGRRGDGGTHSKKQSQAAQAVARTRRMRPNPPLLACDACGRLLATPSFNAFLPIASN